MLRLLRHVTIRRRFQIVVLFALMLVVSVAELFSIGAVVPFLGVLTAPESVFKYELAQPLIHALNITEPEQLLTFLTLIFGIAAVVSGSLRLLLSWTQIRLSYALGADFSAEIYKRTLYQPYAVHLKRNTSEVIAGVTSKADGIVHQTVMPSLTIVSSGHDGDGLSCIDGLGAKGYNYSHTKFWNYIRSGHCGHKETYFYRRQFN